MPCNSACTLPSPPNAVFTGREEEMDILLDLWRRRAPGAVITGMAGVGKTQLAIQFAWTVLGDRAYEETRFITWDPNFGRPQPDMVAWPESVASASLVILDHMTDFREAYRLQSAWRGKGEPFLVVTTPWLPVLFGWYELREVSLDVLPPQRAVDFVIHLAEPSPLSIDLAWALAERLGYHPAALALVGTYLAGMRSESAVQAVVRKVLTSSPAQLFDLKAFRRRDDEGSPTHQPADLGCILDRSLGLLAEEARQEIAAGKSLDHMTRWARREALCAFLDSGIAGGAGRIHPLMVARAATIAEDNHGT